MRNEESDNDSPNTQPNPFEPAALEWAEGSQESHSPDSKRDRKWFSIVSVAFIGAAVGLSFLAPPLGLPCVAVSIAAPIRVILLRRTRRVESRDEDRPSSLTLFGTSLLVVFAMGFASCIAFVMICLPTGFITFSLLGQSFYKNWLVTMVFGVSSLLAFLVFLWLFRLSLRLRY